MLYILTFDKYIIVFFNLANIEPKLAHGNNQFLLCFRICEKTKVNKA